MAVIHDEYLLNVSLPITVSGDEKDVPLTLEQNSSGLSGTVSGKVYDTVVLIGDVIEGATVKLFDSSGDPYLHTETGVNGSYTFGNVPAGTYYISAAKDGYIMAARALIVVTVLLPVIANIVLLKDANATQGTVYGTVTDSTSTDPISGVGIVLYQEISGEQTIIADTQTIDDGEFVLEDLDPGDYTLLFSKTGYYSSGDIPVTVTASTDIQQSIELEENPDASTGTISGVITNATDIPIAGAFVGLYTSTDGTPETLIATTYTNITGWYMFGGIAAGEYIVKAKASEPI